MAPAAIEAEAEAEMPLQLDGHRCYQGEAAPG